MFLPQGLLKHGIPRTGAGNVSELIRQVGAVPALDDITIQFGVDFIVQQQAAAEAARAGAEALRFSACQGHKRRGEGKRTESTGEGKAEAEAEAEAHPTKPLQGTAGDGSQPRIPRDSAQHICALFQYSPGTGSYRRETAAGRGQSKVGAIVTKASRTDS